MSHPSKSKGYRVEKLVEKELRRVGFAWLTRTGSVNYALDAADLTQEVDPSIPMVPVHIVATRDNGGPTLYSLSGQDLERLVSIGQGNLRYLPVYVQVKARKRTWLGTVWRGLVRATAVLLG